MMRLNDSQVLTLMFILLNQPPLPMDMDRYPTVQMFLNTGVVQRMSGKLCVNRSAPEFEYQYVVSADAVDHIAEYRTFEQMEKADKIAFSAERQSDTYYWFTLSNIRKLALAHGGTFDPEAGTCTLPEGCEITTQIQSLIETL